MKNDDEMVELVLARLSAMPEHIKIHMGGNNSFDKDDLIKHVKEQDKFGQKFVMMQKEYLKASIMGFANVK